MIDSPSALVLASLLGAAVAGLGPAHAQILYDGDAFTVTDTSVVQGPFRAEAPSRTRLTSNYERETTAVNFKFSLNRRDNERRSGDDRRLRLDPRGGEVLTPVYVFGGRESEGLPEPTTVRPRDDDSVAVTFRVDLRPVLRSFRATGVYQPAGRRPHRRRGIRGRLDPGRHRPAVPGRGRAVRQRAAPPHRPGRGRRLPHHPHV